MAEFLHILAQEYAYPQLTGEVLKELSNKDFNSNDTKGPKSVSAFLMKISELQPQLVNKHMTLLSELLKSEVHWSSMIARTCTNGSLGLHVTDGGDPSVRQPNNHAWPAVRTRPNR
jgi:hypothetical protein